MKETFCWVGKVIGGLGDEDHLVKIELKSQLFLLFSLFLLLFMGFIVFFLPFISFIILFQPFFSFIYSIFNIKKS